MKRIEEKELFQIIRKFAIEGNVTEIAPYGSGHINDTFRVKEALDGREVDYILQRMNKDVFSNQDQLMENVVAVTEFLAKKITEQGGDPSRETLRVIPTTDGKPFYREADGDGWRLYPFITDTIGYDQGESAEDLYRSGYAFGNFQYLLAEFPAEKLHETIPNFHNTVDRFAKFKAAVEKDALARAGAVQKEIQFIFDREKDCHFFSDLLAAGELPLRVTHNDTKLNNVLFDRETKKAICVIDLDTVMPGLAAHDFGDSIRFGASTAAEDEKDLSKVSCSMELFEGFFAGFMDGCRGSLTKQEVETLPMGAKIMTLECGMRFLTDYLEGDTYFKIHYPGHNLDRARTQLKLVQDMEEKWEQMTAIVQK